MEDGGFTVFENNNLCKMFGNRVHNRYFGNSQLGCWSSTEKICHVNRYIYVLGLLILHSIHSLGIFPCAISNDHVFHFFKFRNGVTSYVYLESPLHSTANFLYV